MDLEIEGLGDATLIGAGGFGSVYRARQTTLERDVAVKILHVGPGDEAARRRFFRECRALAALSGHPNVVAIYDGRWPEGRQPYLVMEFVPGGTYDDVIRRDGPLPWRTAFALGAKLGRALHAAHEQQIVHCDVKPANLLLSSWGEPQIADFGIARFGETSGAYTAAHAGTLLYAPPELLDGVEPAPSRDIYSLAATIVTLISGLPPFDVDPSSNALVLMRHVAESQPRDLRPLGLPEHGQRVLSMAMAKDATARPASAGDFADLLDAAVADPDDARTVPVLDAAWPPARGDSGSERVRPPNAAPTEENPAAPPLGPMSEPHRPGGAPPRLVEDAEVQERRQRVRERDAERLAAARRRDDLAAERAIARNRRRLAWFGALPTGLSAVAAPFTSPAILLLGVLISAVFVLAAMLIARGW